MLSLHGISKRFGARRALSNVTLEVAAGEAVLLVGRNGAGKTTLLRIATGYLDADEGDVTIDGVVLSADRSAAQKKLGYLPEHAPAPVELTVRAHLMFRARQKGHKTIDDVVKTAQLESELDRPIGALSKGYRQRVGLADALLGSPALLVLDEPTSGLDPIQTKEMRTYLKAAVKDRALLVSSHAVVDLEPLATRVAVLRAGELVANDTPTALCKAQGVDRLDAAIVKLLGEES
jgi:ABC-2 type transport system ATP-binding protein